MQTSPLETPSDDFYVSGTFWLTVGLVVLTLVLIALTYWAVKVGRARRVIQWEQTVTPMLRQDPLLANHLRVSWNAQPVTAPTLVTVRLLNAGALDVAATAFDRQRPIVIEFNAPVLALLQPVSTRKNGLLPVRLAGDTVEVGPGLLKRKAEMSIVALTDGESAVTAQMPLENVDVRQASLAQSQNAWWDKWVVAPGVAAIVSALLAAISSLLSR